MGQVEKVNAQISEMKKEIDQIHEVNTSKSILKSSISEYQKRVPLLDATGLEIILSEDVSICTKNLDKITDKNLA